MRFCIANLKLILGDRVTKPLLLLVLLTFSFKGSSQSFSLGGGGIYGDDIDALGVHFRAYYNLPNDKICFGPEFSHFFEQTEVTNGEQLTKKLSEINLNAHYIFELTEKWGAYPLTGANVSFETESIVLDEDVEIEHKSEIGVNLGAGLHRSIGNLVLFIEYDHLFSELAQNSLVIGAFYTFGNKKISDGE